MITTLARCLLLALLPLGAAPVASPSQPAVLRQDPDEKPDNRDDIKELLDTLEDHAGARGKEDQEAIVLIDQLVGLWPELGPKDRKAVVKTLDGCFKQKRQEDENGVRANQLFLAATTALGEMAPESVKPLMGWIGHKTHRKDVALQRMLILKLGKTKDEKAIKPLIKLMDDHDPQIQSAAAEALGEFDGAELKRRKEMFSELLKVVMAVKGIVDTDPTNVIERERYDVIAAPIITSLQRLSGHNEHDPQQWQRWWNKNKKADWDELGDS